MGRPMLKIAIKVTGNNIGTNVPRTPYLHTPLAAEATNVDINHLSADSSSYISLYYILDQ
jgi:hypothetical protein